MEYFNEFSEIDRTYLNTLKSLLDNGNMLELKRFIYNYDNDFLIEDNYMLDLKRLVNDNDNDEIENMILSYEDYINEYKFDIDSDNYEDNLYNCKNGQEVKYEDEILSEDNETALNLNDNMNINDYIDENDIDTKEFNE